MKRIIALVWSTISLVACAMPTAPATKANKDADAAKAFLHSASRAGPTASGKLAGN